MSSTVPQIHLPPELVYAVLIRVDDLDDDDQPLKRGLATCSQTCRYWAAFLRPLLFWELALRSGEDVSQLLVFLDADFLQPALSGCIYQLNVIEDQASVGSPWGHQLIRLANRLPNGRVFQWIMKGAPAAPDGQHPLNLRKPPLPFVTIPRSLPRSILGCVQSLTLSGVVLRSVQDLVSFLAHQMLCPRLVLDNVTFVEETAEEIRVRRVPASRSESALVAITMSHGLQDRDAVQRWMKTSNVLFASQGLERLDEIALTLVESCLNLLVLHSGRQTQAENLRLLRRDYSRSRYFHPLSE